MCGRALGGQHGWTPRGRRRRPAGRGLGPARRSRRPGFLCEHQHRALPRLRCPPWRTRYTRLEQPAVDPPTSAVLWSLPFRLVASHSAVPMRCHTLQLPFCPSDAGSQLWHLAFLPTCWPASTPFPQSKTHHDCIGSGCRVSLVQPT